MSRRPRTVAVAGFVAAALLIAGCSGLPSTSEVRPRMSVGAEQPREELVVRPDSPRTGAGPEEIAAGFLRAQIGQAESYATSRQYLTGAAERSWKPDAGVVVLKNDNLSTRRLDDSRVLISALAVAEVDADGRLQQFAAPERRSIQLGMSRAGGQWRVNDVPADAGLWLSRSNFERAYQSKRVYFPAVGPDKLLVPDVRWFPETGMATALARAVIGSVPTWLDQVATSPVPRGVRLQPDAVPISGDRRVATVSLSREVLAASPADRQALSAAINQTVSQASGVGQVAIEVGGAPLDVPGARNGDDLTDLGYTVESGPSGPVLIRSGDRLSWSDSEASDTRQRRSTPSGGPLPAIPDRWFALATSGEGKEIAAIGGDRRTLARWQGTRLLSLPSFGSHLVRPSYDRGGGLWVAGRALTGSRTFTDAPRTAAPSSSGATSTEPPAGPPTVWRIDTTQPGDRAQAEPVSAEWLDNREIVSLAVSPEGRRMALVVRDPDSDETSVLLSGIQRNETGQVQRLGEPVEVNASLYGLTSVTWSDESSLVVLGSARPDAIVRQPIAVPLGGLVQPLGIAPGAESVVGSSLPQDRVLVTTDRDRILARQGRGWTEFARGDEVAASAS